MQIKADYKQDLSGLNFNLYTSTDLAKWHFLITILSDEQKLYFI